MPLDSTAGDPKDHPHSEIHRSARGVFLVFLVLALVGVFVLWRIEGDRANRIQTALVETFIPAIEFGQRPGQFLAGVVSTITEISRASRAHEALELTQRRLNEWQIRAQQLELENAALKKIVGFVDTHEVTVITAPIVADTSSPFQNSLLVRAGSESGVENGWMATDGVGVIGHVTSVGPSLSRIILIQDTTSRIPAKLPASGMRVLAVGNNMGLLDLVVLDGNSEIKAGARVVTSGDAGVFIPNHLIGTIRVADDGDIGILPAASIAALRYVSLIKDSHPPTETLHSAIVGNRVSVPLP